MASIMRRIRTRLPTCLSIGLGAFLSMRLLPCGTPLPATSCTRREKAMGRNTGRGQIAEAQSINFCQQLEFQNYYFTTIYFPRPEIIFTVDNVLSEPVIGATARSKRLPRSEEH